MKYVTPPEERNHIMNRSLIAALALTLLAGCSPADPSGSGGEGSTVATGSGGASSATGAGGACADGQKACGGTCVNNDVDLVEVDGKLWRDCDGDPFNGCEVEAFHDVNNCGGCGRVCNIDHADQKCEAPGFCEFVACLPGYVDCDGMIVSGCEAHLVDDAHNCGACGVDCGKNGTCSNGMCD
jgi:hypothetical protein